MESHEINNSSVNSEFEFSENVMNCLISETPLKYRSVREEQPNNGWKRSDSLRDPVRRGSLSRVYIYAAKATPSHPLLLHRTPPRRESKHTVWPYFESGEWAMPIHFAIGWQQLSRVEAYGCGHCLPVENL